MRREPEADESSESSTWEPAGQLRGLPWLRVGTVPRISDQRRPGGRILVVASGALDVLRLRLETDVLEEVC